MNRSRYIVWSIILLVIFILLGYFLIREERPGAKYPFRYGLDLVGGTELVYKADTSKVDDVAGAMDSLKAVIERRVNIFGVSEPVIQTESAGLVSGNAEERLLVGLPQVTDLAQAENLIGQTPTLEFRLERPNAPAVLSAASTTGAINLDQILFPAQLTGRYLEHASVQFDSRTNAPTVALQFTPEGAALFAQITKDNVGKPLAIVLDGQVIEAPTIQGEIDGGQAQITGSFTPDQAKQLVNNLNLGALPVPISLETSQTVGASLGAAALHTGVRAGIIGFLALALFLILWYRLPGLVASVALVSYIILSLVVFKLIPVTLTAAGLAGFILSIGMAVDANVLIFERTKEELKRGRSITDALHEGFHRAWLSIRDSNISSIITAIVLFWLGTSSVKGFALTLGLGVLISMFTAITVSRTFLFATCPPSPAGGSRESKFMRFLFSNGLHIK